MTVEMGALIGLAGGILGMVLGYSNWRRIANRDIQTDAVGSGELRSDVSYIKRGIDDIKVDMKVTEKRVGDLCERVTRVEESAKQAHHRIDGIKE